MADQPSPPNAAGAIEAAVADAVDALRLVAPHDAPLVAVVAGSGLSGLGDYLADPTTVAYEEIPGWPVSTVAGHAGRLMFGRLADRPVVIAAGRAHLYEGYAPQEITFSVRVMNALGADTLVVTNAAGALTSGMAPGDVMIIRDHIFLPGISGRSPLVGPNDDQLGPRFPGMADAYDAGLAAEARQALTAEGFTVHEGIYVMVAGPSFETPAEARFLRAIGADVVGMSTAPEVVVARHMGMRVLGISVITNAVVVDDDQQVADQPLSDGAALHQEVTTVGAAAAPRLAAAVKRVVERM